MACLSTPSLFLPSFAPRKNLNSHFILRKTSRKARSMIIAASQKDDNVPPPTKLVTFLGKGGSGKTTSAIFAAQHYAMAGLKTCLVTHSQDPTAEYLLDCKIGTSPIMCNNNLSAVRLETTKMLLEPLSRLKQADARVNLTQGVLEGVAGEELGVLPGMDSIFSAFELGRLVGLFDNVAQKNQNDKFDVIIYDGISTEETIRMIGATRNARLYVKYLRFLSERTDLGRLAGPTIVRFVDEAISLGSGKSYLNGQMSPEIWEDLEQSLERGSSVFAEPHRFGCYLVMDPNSPASLNSALRYWGCAIQAGAQVSGAFAIASPSSHVKLAETVKKSFLPLPFAFFPPLSMGAPLKWNEIVLDIHSKDARHLLTKPTNDNGSITHSVKFDPANKSVTLFMPGFDKSEIKLCQYRGGSELLVEAGDQRRIIRLPSEMQGKVGGAKFIDRSLIITMR